MSVDKSERALLVVNSLVAGGEPKFKWLYEFCEASGVAIAETLLRPHYAGYHKLTAPKATKCAFLQALKSLGGEAKAVDVLLMLHGSENRLYFDGGAVRTADLRSELAALGLGGKLRMLYSTCCYSDSHFDDFVAGEFRSAVGSVAVNTNVATENPMVLTMWAAGSMLKDAVAGGENPLTRVSQDQIAKLMGFADADSDKTIRGNGRITITSVA